MKKVLTIGGATQDVFLSLADIKSKELEIDNIKQEFLLLPHGRKLEVTNLYYASGGGATNSAVSFKRLGFEVEAFFKVGEDRIAEFITSDLKKNNIKIDNISRSVDNQSGISFILPAPSGDRSVLAYRGVNEFISQEDINLDIFKNKDFVYVAPLSGKSISVLLFCLERAKINSSLVALNPSKSELISDIELLKKALSLTDILFVNLYESKLISQKLFNGELESNILIQKILTLGPKVVVITAGKRGVSVGFDNKVFYHASLPTKVVSTVGAGDSFASAFSSVLIKEGLTESSIKKALLYGLINSTSVITHRDSKEGLLTEDQIESKLSHLDLKSIITS